MSDSDPVDPPSDPAPDRDEGFQIILDEDPAIEQAVQWASKELIAGRSFEAVQAALAAGGWSILAADEIVEEARKQTRAERGVITRDDVAILAESRYRRTLANLRWIAFGGLPALIVGVRNILISLKGVRNPPTQGPSERVRELPADDRK